MNESDAIAPVRTAAFVFVFITVLLDMLALGIIVPVLPKLVVDFLAGDTARAAAIYGIFGTAGALMQFLFSPLHGVLSDRFGRRPLILLSNFGLGLDYILMALAPNLWWLLLTKRIGNARKMLPPDWGEGYPNVVLMATLESQEVWDRDIDKLMSVPAVLHGVSVEPMLSHVDICGWQPDWIITGGESGPNRRPLDMDNVRSMRDQCASAGIAFHHKQNGGLRGKDNGCLVDGVEHKHFPVALR